MTNLLIGYHDIEASAVEIICDDVAFSRLHPLHNLKGGFMGGAAVSDELTSATNNITFRQPDGANKAAEYLYIPKYRKISADSWAGDLLYQHSPDDSAWTTAINVTDANAEATAGRDKCDLFKTFALTESRKHHRLRWQSATTGRRISIGAPFIGTWLDMQADFSEWEIMQDGKDKHLQADSGALIHGRTFPNQRRLSVLWEGVTQAKVEEFQRKVVRKKGFQSFLLHASSKQFVIDEEEVLHCRLLSAQIMPNRMSSWRNIRATFIEEL
jgi:hypothetical protein